MSIVGAMNVTAEAKDKSKMNKLQMFISVICTQLTGLE